MLTQLLNGPPQIPTARGREGGREGGRERERESTSVSLEVELHRIIHTLSWGFLGTVNE